MQVYRSKNKYYLWVTLSSGHYNYWETYELAKRILAVKRKHGQNAEKHIEAAVKKWDVEEEMLRRYEVQLGAIKSAMIERGILKEGGVETNLVFHGKSVEVEYELPE